VREQSTEKKEEINKKKRRTEKKKRSDGEVVDEKKPWFLPAPGWRYIMCRK